MEVARKFFRFMAVALFMVCGFMKVMATTHLAGEKRTVKDTLSRIIQIPDRVERILSLQPEITRILVALEAGDKLVGLDYFVRRDDHLFKIIFPAQERLPVVSKPDDSVNKEVVVALRPDIIFASPSELLVPDSIQQALGIPVVALSSLGSFRNLLDEIELVGRVTGREARASELISFFNENMNAIRQTVGSLSPERRPRVYLAFWSSLLRTPVDYGPVTAAGGVNVAAGLLPTHPGSPGAVVTLEQIIAWDPDVILVHGNYPPSERRVTVEQVVSDKRLRSLKAVRNGHVFYTFGYWYWWDPAQVLVETLYLVKLFYPEKLRDFELEAAGNTIFEKFYGQAGLFSKLGEALAFHDWIKEK